VHRGPGRSLPAPDAFSAGTRRLGRGRSTRTAPPHHSAVSSVAAFSRSRLVVPITEPVTKFVTGTLCHMVIRSGRGGTAAVQDGWLSGTSAVWVRQCEMAACRLITRRSQTRVLPITRKIILVGRFENCLRLLLLICSQRFGRARGERGAHGEAANVVAVAAIRSFASTISPKCFSSGAGRRFVAGGRLLGGSRARRPWSERFVRGRCVRAAGLVG
jgi:hypothetical protein